MSDRPSACCAPADAAGPTLPETAQQVQLLLENRSAFLAFLVGRLGGDRALAEDVLQDAFVRSIDGVRALRDEEALIPWFYRMLRNAVVDQQRRGVTRLRALEAFADGLAPHAESGPLHQAVCRCITQLAGTLKPEYAHALAQIELEGVAVKDYAVAHGISSTNAAVRVFRAREALRKQVERACGACAEHGCVDCDCAVRAPA